MKKSYALESIKNGLSIKDAKELASLDNPELKEIGELAIKLIELIETKERVNSEKN